MLSRVAENIYWLARYLERAEDSARMVIATRNAILDIAPVSNVQPLDWEQLITITGGRDLFAKRGIQANEQSIADFLIRDETNPGAILNTLKAARENLRSTREHFPREAWEIINHLFLRVQSTCREELATTDQLALLEMVIGDALRVTGLLESTMCRDLAFSMFTLGRHLERADMTTRILDVRGALMLERQEALNKPLRNALWLVVLKSLSGDQMYRKQVQFRVRGVEVLAFLLKSREFPRAFSHCIQEVSNCLRSLDQADKVWRIIRRIEKQLYLADIHRLALNIGLHDYLDHLQILLNELHQAIEQSYFNRTGDESDTSRIASCPAKAKGETSTDTSKTCSRPPTNTPLTGGTSA